MQEAKDFVLWFLENLPTFLLAQPIVSFVGMAFLAFTINLFRRIKNI